MQSMAPLSTALEKMITNCLSSSNGNDWALSADINDFNAQNLT